MRTEDGVWRRETIHRMGRRLPGWDYRRPGIYMITIVLADRHTQALGELRVRRKQPPACAGGAGPDKPPACAGGAGQGVWLAPAAQAVGTAPWLSVSEARAQALEPGEVEAMVAFSDLGRAVFEHFRRMGEFTPGLRPVYCAVMPDHLHLLLKIERPLARPLGNAIGGFKTGCEKLYASMGGTGRLFADGFVDEIVLRAGQLDREFHYLLDNPRRLAVKRLFPELFRHTRRIGVRLRVAPQGQAIGYFSAIGNHFLLDRSLAQVQVSRSWFRYRREGGKMACDAAGEPLVELSTPEYAVRREALLSAARRGEVLLSPCVSDGERQIAREALAAGLRLVTLRNKGFSDLHKPSGRYFDACAEGRLLLLAPAAWPWQLPEKPMTRHDATAMNRLCQWMAGDGAAEINYHGMKPTDIDTLALAAVEAKPVPTL